MKTIIKATALFLAVIFCISSPTTALASEQSYITYFSTEREFFTDELWENSWFYTYKIEDGNLYSVQYEPITQRTLLLSDTDLVNFTVALNELILVTEDKIYSSNWDATEISLVYTLPDSIVGHIDSIYANDDIIWFRIGNCIYRLYRQSNVLDFILSDNDMLGWMPVSNYCIEYDVYSEEYLKAIEDGTYDNGMPIREYTSYQYNSYTGKSFLAYCEPYDYEKVTKEVQTRKATHYSSYSTTIAGKRIPESKYPIGSFVNSTGVACKHHDLTNTNNCSTDGTCGCLKLGNKDGLGTGIQCLGFAKQIYWDLFGTNTGTLTTNITLTSNTAKDFFESLHPGAYIRSNGHSLIFLKAGNTYVDFYHANYESPCEVSVSKFLYTDILEDYKTLKEVYNPPHTYITVVSYTTKNHTVKCSGCSEQKTESHTLVQSGNKQVCSVCGYSIAMSRGQ